MKPGLLKARELCDLVNYVLGLPERIGSRTIVRAAIHPCVVSGWQIKPTRRQVESWCDRQLVDAGIIPPKYPSRRGGRKPGAHVPRELLAWASPAFLRGKAA